jgi:hypothetical protein
MVYDSFVEIFSKNRIIPTLLPKIGGVRD